MEAVCEKKKTVWLQGAGGLCASTRLGLFDPFSFFRIHDGLVVTRMRNIRRDDITSITASGFLAQCFLTFVFCSFFSVRIRRFLFWLQSIIFRKDTKVTESLSSNPYFMGHIYYSITG
jgi:hypothetical protein